MSKKVRPRHASGYDSFDMFCGAGGFSEGVSRRGVEVKAAANHERICIQTHNTNFPDADHYLTDVSLSDMRTFPRARLLFASPECFPAGTLILTVGGLVPIEEVRVGDMALTHKGRWRPVVRTQSRQGIVVTVTGQGHMEGIRVTPNHRFWVRASRQRWVNGIRRDKREWDAPTGATSGRARRRCRPPLASTIAGTGGRRRASSTSHGRIRRSVSGPTPRPRGGSLGDGWGMGASRSAGGALRSSSHVARMRPVGWPIRSPRSMPRGASIPAGRRSTSLSTTTRCAIGSIDVSAMAPRVRRCRPGRWRCRGNGARRCWADMYRPTAIPARVESGLRPYRSGSR